MAGSTLPARATIIRLPKVGVPKGESTDFAARVEMLGDVGKALANVLRQMFPGVRITHRVGYPPQSPNLNVCVVVDLDAARRPFPPDLRTEMERAGQAMKELAERTFPTVPLHWMTAWPPEFFRPALIAHTDDTELPQPYYPYIHRAKAVLRPTAAGREAIRKGQIPWLR